MALIVCSGLKRKSSQSVTKPGELKMRSIPSLQIQEEPCLDGEP